MLFPFNQFSRDQVRTIKAKASDLLRLVLIQYHPPSLAVSWHLQMVSIFCKQ